MSFRALARFERKSEAIHEDVFSPALAFGAGQFPALFDDIPFSIASRTDHLVLQSLYPKRAVRRRVPAEDLKISFCWQYQYLHAEV